MCEGLSPVIMLLIEIGGCDIVNFLKPHSLSPDSGSEFSRFFHSNSE